MRIYFVSICFCLCFCYTASLGQAPTTERKVLQTEGVETFQLITKYPDGTTTTVTYETKTIDGKRVDVKKRSSKEVVDVQNDQKTKLDTFFRSDGVTVGVTTEERWSSGTKIYRDEINYLENHKVNWGVKIEFGYDGKTRYYNYDPKKKEFNSEPRDTRPGNLLATEDPKPVPEPTSCIKPGPEISVGYSFLKKDDGGEKINMNGPALSFDWYFGDRSPKPRGIISQFGVGMNLASVSRKEEDAKFNLTTLTAGPELRLSYLGFVSTGFQVQGGIARDGFKLGDIKEHEISPVLAICIRQSFCVGSGFKVGASVGRMNTYYDNNSQKQTIMTIFAALQLLGVF